MRGVGVFYHVVLGGLDLDTNRRRAPAELGQCILRSSVGRLTLMGPTSGHLKRILAVDGMPFNDACGRYLVSGLRRDIEEKWLTVYEHPWLDITRRSMSMLRIHERSDDPSHNTVCTHDHTHLHTHVHTCACCNVFTDMCIDMCFCMCIRTSI